MINTAELIVAECEAICALLLEKNRKYGDAAVNPLRCFSKASVREQILVRLDDKLNRFINRADDEDEDVIVDMIGYLILYKITDPKVREAHASLRDVEYVK